MSSTTIIQAMPRHRRRPTGGAALLGFLAGALLGTAEGGLTAAALHLTSHWPVSAAFAAGLAVGIPLVVYQGTALARIAQRAVSPRYR